MIIAANSYLNSKEIITKNTNFQTLLWFHLFHHTYRVKHLSEYTDTNLPVNREQKTGKKFQNLFLI